MKNFAIFLKQARLDKKLKLTDISGSTGIDIALLSKIENGNRYATKKQVHQFIEILKLNEANAISVWLGDKIMYELRDEDYALEALLLAEDHVKYERLNNGPVVPDKALKLLLEQADKLKKKWSKRKPLDGIQLHKMKEYFNLNYTYESNKIEGNTLTLKETFLVVNEGLTVGGKSMNEHLEAINHADAIEFIAAVANNQEAFTERVLKEIHYLILKGIDKSNAGIYRKVPVYISGSSHIPPQPFIVAKKMEEIFEFYLLNKNKMHPILLAASMHEKIVSVHPFIDGNGRTCRLIMNLILLANGFTVAILKGDNKSRVVYYSALEQVQSKNNADDFFKLVAQTCIDSLKEHIKLAG